MPVGTVSEVSGTGVVPVGTVSQVTGTGVVPVGTVSQVSVTSVVSVGTVSQVCGTGVVHVGIVSELSSVVSEVHDPGIDVLLDNDSAGSKVVVSVLTSRQTCSNPESADSCGLVEKCNMVFPCTVTRSMNKKIVEEFDLSDTFLQRLVSGPECVQEENSEVVEDTVGHKYFEDSEVVGYSSGPQLSKQDKLSEDQRDDQSVISLASLVFAGPDSTCQLKPIPAYQESFHRVVVGGVRLFSQSSSGYSYRLTKMCMSTRYREAISLRAITFKFMSWWYDWKFRKKSLTSGDDVSGVIAVTTMSLQTFLASVNICL